MNNRSYAIIITLCILMALSALGYALWLHQQQCGPVKPPRIEFEPSIAPNVENITGTWEGLSHRGFTYCLLNLTASNTGWMVEYATGLTNPVTATPIEWEVQGKKIRITGVSEQSKLCGDGFLDGPINTPADRPDRILILNIYEPDVAVQYTLIPQEEMAEKRASALARANEIQNK